MPRIRSIKPEMWQSPQVMNLTRDARCLFLGLITQADDEGRGSADLRKLRSTIFPGDEDATPDTIERWCHEIAAQRLALFYACDEHGKLYQIITFKRHQTINKARPSIYPAPPKKHVEKASLPEGSRSTTVAIPEDSRTTTEGSDLISSGSDLKDLFARARANPAGSRGAGTRKGTEGRDFQAEALRLAEQGMDAETIAASLRRHSITLDQVREWIAGTVANVLPEAGVA